MRYDSFYDLRQLSDELIFIKWYKTANVNTRPENEYIEDLRKRVITAPRPLYFLSDLRQGRIVDVGVLNRLGSLTRHPNYGGGSAFSEDVISSMFVGVFSKFADAEKGSSVFYKTIDQALAYLEALNPGVSSTVDWETFIASFDSPK
ncbi:MAG: hypothetical protein LCI00_18280 [Chloroflexi bacterium]|nr:hypothetical protein [Chloroflexota bacterium]MCC6897151.1 hypothetical protein [Anaerolineae bacterium]